MLVAGPSLMDLVFGGDFDYDRVGLVLISARHGPVPGGGHAQPGAARARARAQAACVLGRLAAAGFVVFLLVPGFDDPCSRWRSATRRGAAGCCSARGSL